MEGKKDLRSCGARQHPGERQEALKALLAPLRDALRDIPFKEECPQPMKDTPGVVLLVGRAVVGCSA